MNCIGKFIKILLSNNVAVDGIVKQWDNKIILRALDQKSDIIINRPKEDIILIKIYDDLPSLNENIIKNINEPGILKSDKQNTLISTLNKLQKTFIEKVDTVPSKDKLKLQKLAELKKVLNKEEQEIASNTLKNHEIGIIKKVPYEHPGFFYKK